VEQRGLPAVSLRRLRFVAEEHRGRVEVSAGLPIRVSRSRLDAASPW
jgi:hypothetical protein